MERIYYLKNMMSLFHFRNGEFVSPTITFVDGKFYDSTTGLELEEDQLEEAKQYQEIVQIN